MQATLFTRCNRFRQATPYTLEADSINHIYNYVNTTAGSGGTRPDFNKGELQYCYQVFEGGGVPSIIDDEGPIQTLANSMSSNTWAQLTTGDTATLNSIKVYTGGSPNRSAFEFAQQVFWNPNAKELHFRGGGASGGAGKRATAFAL